MDRAPQAAPSAERETGPPLRLLGTKLPSRSPQSRSPLKRAKSWQAPQEWAREWSPSSAWWSLAMST